MSTTATKHAMRGLTNLITDIRNCRSKEEEESRVNKELAKIRKKFKEEKEVMGYDKRKYVSKLLYLYMLGYDIDFGFVEAVNLLSSTKFQEKLIGYLAIGIFLHENHEMLPLIVQSLQHDLNSRNEFHQTLALSAIANIGGKEMSESLAPMVQKLLLSKASKTAVKKKSALCLLRLFRKYPDLIPPEVGSDKLVPLLEEPDWGVLTSVMGLLLGLVQNNPKGYEIAIPKIVSLLIRVTSQKDHPPDYEYYSIPSPWLQVKLMRFLSYFPAPSESALRTRLYDTLKRILSSSDGAKGSTINHKNSINAVLFEAITLVIQLDDNMELIKQAINLLGRFIGAKEHSNIRYLGLERLAQVAGLDSETSNLVRKFHDTVTGALLDPDISIRRRAIDLLYTMCDKSNAKQIVGELISYLATADYSLKEELVLKIAILAEKYAVDYAWYVDVILQLIALAGDFVTDDIWFRVVQIVTNHEDIQTYAAKTVLQAVTVPNAHETAVKVAAYILGEFGNLIADSADCAPKIQFDSIFSKLGNCSLTTKALVLSTFVKFTNLYPELISDLQKVFTVHSSFMDPEIQQRACEYLALSKMSADLLQNVLDVMPMYPDRSEQKEEEETPVTSPSVTAKKAPSPTASSASVAPVVVKQTVQATPQPQPQPQPTPSPPPPKKFDPLAELEAIFGTPNVSSPVVPANNSNTGMFVNTSSPVPPAQTTGSTGLEGLLMGINMGGNAQDASITKINSGISGVGIQVTSNTPSTATTVPAFNVSTLAITDALKKLCMVAEGILHQDDKVQIGFKSEFAKGLGRMALFYGNVTSENIENFNATISGTSSVSLAAQAVSNTISARTQSQQLVNITNGSQDVSNNFPTLNLSFTHGGKDHSLVVKLPILLLRFTSPVTLAAPAFYTQWKQLDANEQIAVITTQNSTSAISQALTNMHFAVLNGVDPNPNNLAFAGAYVTGDGQVAGILGRVETNAQAKMLRLTLRTSNAKLSLALKDLCSVFLA